MRIVATADVPAVAHEAFSALGEIDVRPLDDVTALAEAAVLIVRGGRLDAHTLEAATSLRAIARTGAGYDNLDVQAATRLGIPIVYAPGVGSRPVAEGTVALILAAAKRLGELAAVVHDAAWTSRYDLAGLDLDGACLGVIGFGSIGRRVARLCHGLGMRVIAHDPALAGSTPLDARPVSLDELVASADVISLHCDLTERTRGLVDRELLARVKPGAVLVNVARGEIVESEDALLEALALGRLSAVALDVFPSEPPDPGHPLYSDPRVICTPHAVGLTARWNEQVFQSLARGVEGVLAGGLPGNVLNPEAMAGRARVAE